MAGAEGNYVSEAPSEAETKAAVRGGSPTHPSGAGGFFLPYLAVAGAALTLALFRVGSISISPTTEDAGVHAVASSNSLQSWNEASLAGNKTGPPRPDDPALAGRAPGTFRVRLGDVVTTDVKNLMMAAMWDSRFAILPPSGAPAKGSRRAQSKSARDDAFFLRVGMPERPPEQKLAPPEIYLPPSKFEAPNQAAPPNPPANLEARATSVHAGTTAEIVTSATMMGLLKADAAGVAEVTMLEPPPAFMIAPEKWANAASEGLSRVWRHLRSVGALHTSQAAEAIYPASVAALMTSYFATPLPFPGGASFTAAKTIDIERPPPDTADLFNPAFSVEEPVTTVPAIAFMVVSALGFLIGRWRQTTTGSEVDPRLAGTISVATLAVLIVTTRDLWRQIPDSWAATLPGLLCLALGAAAVELWVRAALRAGAASKTPEPGRDNALRSVLYRDTPIDDVTRDRLGFQVLVGSLRRFLDNPDTVPPVVVSVNGPWGSGKSSTMKMLARELEKTGRFQTAWFNAWQYHEEPQILPAFLQTIARELGAQRKTGFSLRLAWARAKRFSFWQYMILTAPAAILIAGTWMMKTRPDLFQPQRIWQWLITGDVTEHVTKAIALAGSAAGVLAAAWTTLSAFSLRFARLFAVSNGPHAALIDDFTREFALYREAVGKGKFLFVVDDLDRCPPDKVVAVLKAINLIVTSADETNRSFFVLGFDPDYIVRAIEQHFKSLAPQGFEHEDRFGQEYLKKMVTLSVSVPKPRPEKMRDLLARIDSESAESPIEPKPGVGFMRLLVAQAREVPAWGWRLAAATACAAAIALGVAATLSPRSARVATVRIEGGTQELSSTTGVTQIAMPAIKENSSRPKWWLWGIPAAMALLMTGLLIGSTRPAMAERSYVREPHDSEEFKRAIDRCMNLLPSNPRDLVRTVNLMRMQYLLQSSPQAPFSGKPLSEWECVSYTLLQQRRPWMFNSDALEAKVIPALRGARSSPSPGEFYSRISIDGKTGADVAQDILLLERLQRPNRNDDISHLVDPNKLQRYADLNRYSANGGYRPDWDWQGDPVSEKPARAEHS
jgi:hypothetical protein